MWRITVFFTALLPITIPLQSWPNDCSSLAPQDIQSIDPVLFSSLPPRCARTLSTPVIQSISYNQTSYIPPSVFAYFSTSQLSVFTVDMCRALWVDALDSLGSYPNPKACAGITGQCIQAIDADELTGLTGECLDDITPPTFSRFDAEAINNLSLDAVSRITFDQLHAINSSACQGFMESQLHYLNSSVCSAFRLPCLQHLTNCQFGGLTKSCVQALPLSFFSQLSDDVITSISAEAASVLGPEHWMQILRGHNSDIWNRFRMSVFQAVPKPVIEGFLQYWKNGSILDYMYIPTSVWFNGSLDNCSWIQLALTPNISASYISNFRRCTQNSLAGLRSGHAAYVPAASFQTIQRFDDFSADFISNVSGDQVQQIPCSSFNNFSLLVAMSFAAVPSLKPCHLDAILQSTNAGFPGCQYVSAMSDEQKSILLQSKWKEPTNRCLTSAAESLPVGLIVLNVAMVVIIVGFGILLFRWSRKRTTDGYTHV